MHYPNTLYVISPSHDHLINVCVRASVCAYMRVCVCYVRVCVCVCAV